MSTVAWDGKKLAADKQCSFGTTPVETTKIFEVKRGAREGVNTATFLVGATGQKTDAILFREWVQNGRPKSPKPALKENFSGLVIEPGCTLTYYCDNTLVPIEMPAGQMWALGSGSDYALGAMYAGADAEQAVEIATILDINTGLGVDVLTLEGE